MSNDGGGKIKQKRKNVPSKPYGRSQSFLRKVKDTFKDILQPSWLGSLVSSFKPTAAKPESAPSTPMPPQMRPENQFSSSTPRRNAFPLNSLHRPTRVAAPPNMYSTVDGHVPFMSYAAHSHSQAGNHSSAYDDPINLGDFQISSGLTTSVPPPQPPPQPPERQDESVSLDDSRVEERTKEKPKQNEEESQGRVTPDLDTSAASTASQRHESSSFFRKSSKRARTGPQFNISLFSTPRPSTDSSMIIGTSFQQSPYYPGKTTYGGASSHRKSRLKATAPYQSNISVKKVTPKPANKSSSSTVTSSTARRILDALESMPSVLHDAKRIPVNNSSLYDSPLSFTPSSFPRRRSLQQTTSRVGTPAGAPPISRISALGMASIAKNRQYLLPTREQPAEEAKEAEKETPARVTSAPVSAASPAETSQHSSGKMKRDKSHHYHTQKSRDDDVVEIPKLPTNFTLPSDGFKLDIGIKAPTPKSKSSPASEPAPVFTFSSPIMKLTSPVTASPGTPAGFQFSSPIGMPDKKDEKTNKEATSDMTFGSTSGLKLKTKPQAKEVNPSSSFAPASELKEGSVLDILGKGSAFAASKSGKSSASSTEKSTAAKDVKEPANSLLDKLKPAPGSWDCPICMINNKAERMTCAACEAKKPEPASKKSASITTGSSGSWNCSSCSVVNSGDRNSCEGCTAPRLAKKAPAPKAGGQGTDLLAKLKPVEGSWECPTCMVPNKSDADKCVCCSTVKPQPKNSGSNGPMGLVKRDALLDKFKPPAENWECPVCMISNKPEAQSCLACSAPNPTKSNKSQAKETTDALAKLKRPADAWTCDTCLVSNNATALKCIACETPKPGATKASGFAKPGVFLFGSNPSAGFVVDNKTSSSAVFSFGGASKSDTDLTSKTTDSTSSALKFGTASEVSSSSASGTTGGFKFSAAGSDKDSALSGGFVFGAPASETKTDSKSDSNTVGGFAFGAKVSESKNDSNVKLTTVGGFNFGAKASESKTESKSDSTPVDSKKDSAVGGIQFGQINSDSKDAPSLGTFAFNAGNLDTSKPSSLAGVLFNSDKTTASLVGTSITTNTSSAAGGLTFSGSSKPKRKADDDSGQTKTMPELKFGGPMSLVPGLSQPPAQATEEKIKKENGSVGGFSFTPVSTAPSQPNSTSFGTISVDLKSFGAGQGNIKVQSVFGSDSEPSAKRKHTNEPGSSAPSGFTFGQQISTSSFGQTNSSSSTPTFGLTTNPATTTCTAALTFGTTASAAPSVSSTPSFNFGQPVTTSSATKGFGFGQPASTAPKASSTPTFNFKANSATPAASTTPASVGGFSFAPSTSTASKPSFNFGQTATTQAATSTAPAVFAFGQSNPSQPAAASATFNFRATSTTKAPSFGGFNAAPAQSAAAPAFSAAAAPVFGQQQSTPTPFGSQSTATPFGGQSTATPFSQPAPAFGATAPAQNPGFGSTSTVPAFGAAATKPAAPVFGAGSTGFGSATSEAPPAFGSTTTASSSGGFNFSQSVQPGSFAFGAQPQASTATFQFGANKATQPAPTPSQPAATPGFNFSATPNMNFGATPTPAAPSQPFQFNAAATPSSDGNPFSIAPSPNIAGRKIKRATRKLKGR